MVKVGLAERQVGQGLKEVRELPQRHLMKCSKKSEQAVQRPQIQLKLSAVYALIGISMGGYRITEQEPHQVLRNELLNGQFSQIY